ncbi:DUF1289 domain-containing protein [Psychromonas sp. MME2]|uniref:DUF1289 domain-containing protein n=1 Tax=unclassified Psychromonas TaxID=2614957 RepID=UPI00339C35F0
MSDIASPCIRNCCLDEKDICIGCFRTMNEIMQWREVNEQEKRVILARVQKRKERDAKSKGDK